MFDYPYSPIVPNDVQLRLQVHCLVARVDGVGLIVELYAVLSVVIVWTTANSSIFPRLQIVTRQGMGRVIALFLLNAIE